MSRRPGPDPQPLLAAIEGATRVGLAAVDVTGRQIYVNPAFCEMVGYAREELLGKRPPFDYWPPEAAGEIRSAFERTVRGEAPAEGFEVRFMRRDGTRFDARLLIAPLGADGDPQGWLASVHDVTEIRRARRDRDQQELVTAIIAHSGEGIVVVDAEGSIRIFNAEAARQHGTEVLAATPDAWASTYGLRRLDGGPLALADIPLHRALQGERVDEARWCVHRPDGSVRILAGTATPLLRADGTRTGAMVITRDITGREQELQERAEALAKAEAARAEAERSVALFESILATAPVGLSFLDRDLRYFRINQRLAEINGVPVADTLGRRFTEVVPSVAERVAPIYRRVLATGVPEIDVEVSVTTLAVPEERQFALSAYPIRDAMGAVWMVGSVVREVTAERRAAAERLALRERAVRAEALAASRDALRLSDAILRAVPDAVILTDLAGTITRFGGGARHIFGYVEEEALGRPLAFLHEAHGGDASARAILESVAATGGFTGLARCADAAGASLDVEVTASTFRDESGHPVAVLAIYHDVTERLRAARAREELVRERAAKEAAEASERRLRTLAEATSDIVWRTDPEGRIHVDSPSWRAFTGQSLEAWLGNRGWEAIHPDDLAKVEVAWKQAIESRAAFDIEYRLRRHDGMYVPMAVRGTPVLDAQGSVLEWIGSNLDITARIAQVQERESLLHAAQAARAEAESARQRMAALDRITGRLVGEIHRPAQAMQALVDLLVPTLGAWCAVCVPDPDGVLRVLAFAARDDGPGRWARDWLERRLGRGDDPTDIGATVESGRSTTATIAIDGDATRAAGVLLSVPLVAHGKVVGALVLGHEDPDHAYTADEIALAEEVGVRAGLSFEQARLLEAARQARAAAEDANRAKDEFLAMLGHELRNPLAPIVTALEVMKLRADPGSLQERAIVERQVRHMAHLVDDLLDVSRVTRGKIELRKERVDLADVVARAIETASPLFEQKRQHLATTVPRGLVIDGDPARLAQVFANILTNAAKYTPAEGRIAVTAVTEHDAVLVEITDTGEGIDPALLPHVFDLFTQGDRTVDRAAGGLGLGLTIVKRLVELHGGDAQARSAGRGQGTTLAVRLPLAGAPAAARPALPGTAPRITVPGARVLIVDDNADAATMLAKALETLGFDPAIAHDGPAALAVVAAHRPDAVLLDIGLPVMDGYEVARRLQGGNGTKAPMLIAVTGYGQPSDVARAHAAGFAHHMVKPVDLERLQEILGQAGTTTR